MQKKKARGEHCSKTLLAWFLIFLYLWPPNILHGKCGGEWVKESHTLSGIFPMTSIMPSNNSLLADSPLTEDQAFSKEFFVYIPTSLSPCGNPVEWYYYSAQFACKETGAPKCWFTQGLKHTGSTIVQGWNQVRSDLELVPVVPWKPEFWLLFSTHTSATISAPFLCDLLVRALAGDRVHSQWSDWRVYEETFAGLCSALGKVELTCQGTHTRRPEMSKEGTVTNTKWELWPWSGSLDRSYAWS